MKIAIARPPNWDEILKVFPVAGKAVIFTFGDTIYNPEGILIGPALVAHEACHSVRQAKHPGKADAWWQTYLEDPAFRLAEEVPAHHAEYRNYISRQRDRNEHAKYLHNVALRLSGPLYGGITSLNQAKRLIVTGGKP